MPKLHLYKNEKETCQAFAEWLCVLISDTLQRQDKFTVALFRKQSLKGLYKMIGSACNLGIDWSKVHVFAGDTKCISGFPDKDDATVMKDVIENVPIPVDNIHSIRKDLLPVDAARQYENLIRSYFDKPDSNFDLVILSIDENAVPFSFSLRGDQSNGTEQWVTPIYDKDEDVYKIVLTIPAINAAVSKAFFATGKNKQDLVQQTLKGKYDPEKYPAQLIQTINKTVHWFLDEAAAEKLIKSTS